MEGEAEKQRQQGTFVKCFVFLVFCVLYHIIDDPFCCCLIVSTRDLR